MHFWLEGIQLKHFQIATWIETSLDISVEYGMWANEYKMVFQPEVWL